MHDCVSDWVQFFLQTRQKDTKCVSWIFLVQTRFCGVEFGPNTTEKIEISRGKAEWDFKIFCGVWKPNSKFHSPQKRVCGVWLKHHRYWSNSTDFKWMIWVESFGNLQNFERCISQWNAFIYDCGWPSYQVRVWFAKSHVKIWKCLWLTDWLTDQLTDQLTYGLTVIGARDAYASKNHWKSFVEVNTAWFRNVTMLSEILHWYTRTLKFLALNSCQSFQGFGQWHT